MSTDDLFKEMCRAADGFASGDISDESLHSAVVDYTDAVQLAKPGFTLNALPLIDQITIVVALSERRDAMQRMVKSSQPAGSQRMVAQRQALRSEAADCERIGSLLAAAWGLGWKKS
jgi:hypothetical protein